MKLSHIPVALVISGALLSGCATTGDIERLESKIDTLLAETNRSTLQQIFGDQTSVISQQLNTLSDTQLKRFDRLQQSYVQGNVTLEDVRGKMLNLLGNDDRVVATQRGIYVRDEFGEKIRAISDRSTIKHTRLLSDSELPVSIAENSSLNSYSWGVGRIDDKLVLFPWELTMSTFTKEIVENTAKRTAEEFIKMGGDKKWNRPVYIELVVEEEDKLNISTKEGESEVYVNTRKVTPSGSIQ